MTDRPTSPDPDPLYAEILEIAAGLDREALEPDLTDPALLELVERAVSPYAHLFTPEGLAKARRTATFALATHPEIEPVLERVRVKLAKQGTDVRPTRDAARAGDVARRRSRKKVRP